MALFENSDRKIVLGVAIGFAAAGLARQLAPAFAGLGRPLAKAAIKGGIVMCEKGKVKSAELSEMLEDLVAEVKAEMDETRHEPDSAALGGAGVEEVKVQ